MAVKIIGNESDIERYRKMLHERGLLTKADNPIYKDKPEGYRLLSGSITQCSFSGAHQKGNKIDPDAKLYIKGIANARIIDRMDEIVEPAGGDFRAFLNSPILMADHHYSCKMAIGQVISIMPEYDGLHFEAWIGDPSVSQLTDIQREVRSLVAQGILKTVSIGFIPTEVKAPSFDPEGKLIAPAIVNKWEMLELSIIPIPCNAGSLFDMRSILLNETNNDNQKVLTDIKSLIENETKAESTTVQSLIFDKQKFTVDEAKKWARDHDFRSDKVDETSESIRLRQRDPGDFIEGSFRTIELTDGVKAVIGRLKDNLEMEKKLDELIDTMKTLSTNVETLGSKIDKSMEVTSSILGLVEEKRKPCKPKDEDAMPCEDESDDEMKKKFDAIDQDIADIKNVIKHLIEKL